MSTLHGRYSLLLRQAAFFTAGGHAVLRRRIHAALRPVRIQGTRYLRPARGPTATLNAGPRITLTPHRTAAAAAPRVGGATGSMAHGGRGRGAMSMCHRVARVGRGQPGKGTPTQRGPAIQVEIVGGFSCGCCARDEIRRGWGWMDTNRPFCCGCKPAIANSADSAAAATPVA